MSNILNNLLKGIDTSSYKEEQKKIRIERRNNLSMEDMLGTFIGELVCEKHLPRLSTDFKDNGKDNFYKVSDEDILLNKKLSDHYYRDTANFYVNLHWKEYQDHNKYINEKYLPNPLVINISNINIDAITNKDKFLNSYISVLWDDDFCYYSLKKEDIKIYNNTEGTATIEMILGDE